MYLTLGIIFLHKFVVCKSIKEFVDIVSEIIFSTLMTLNNIYYISQSLLLLPLKKIGWNPMKKNPKEALSFKRCVHNLWPSSIIGLVGVYISIFHIPKWGSMALPVLISFALSIPSTYLSAKKMY